MGKWRPSRRKDLKDHKAKSVATKVRAVFLKWILETSELLDPQKVFWKMAAGRLKSSPFEGIEELRREVDKHLISLGTDPSCRDGDRKCEVNFRRLMGLAEMVGDEDYGFLEEMATSGVPIGVDVELPRTPAVFEEKLKWSVESTDEELHDIISENYASAEEHREDIKRQVMEEV